MTQTLFVHYKIVCFCIRPIRYVGKTLVGIETAEQFSVHIIYGEKLLAAPSRTLLRIDLDYHNAMPHCSCLMQYTPTRLNSFHIL